jgi:hypothetical protein
MYKQELWSYQLSVLTRSNIARTTHDTIIIIVIHSTIMKIATRSTIITIPTHNIIITKHTIQLT